MTITGKEALELHEAIGRRNEQQHSVRLANAKALAAVRGKAPFDLAKLELIADTTDQGRLDPVDERRAEFEEMYYVRHPAVMTLAEFAPIVNERNRWSGG